MWKTETEMCNCKGEISLRDANRKLVSGTEGWFFTQLVVTQEQVCGGIYTGKELASILEDHVESWQHLKV